MNDYRVVSARRRHLPHLTTEEGTYFVTFRQADSLSLQLAQRLAGRRRAHLLADRFLDQSRGSCLLRDPRAAKVVEEAFRHFDGERYFLHGWSVMPNHAHVSFRTAPGVSLADVTHSWKGFTSWKINRILGRKGTLWQDESYDSLLSDQNELDRVLHYISRNPIRAGLVNWPWTGVANDRFLFSIKQR
jgi:putative transposase